VGPRAGLDRCGKYRPHRDSIPDRPARSSVAIPTELPGPQLYTCLILLNVRQKTNNQTTNYTTNRPTKQPNNQPTKQLITQRTNQPNNETTNKPTNQPTKQLITQRTNERTNQLTSLTPCIRVLPEGPPDIQLDKKFPAFCETRRFIAGQTREVLKVLFSQFCERPQ